MVDFLMFPTLTITGHIKGMFRVTYILNQKIQCALHTIDMIVLSIIGWVDSQKRINLKHLHRTFKQMKNILSIGMEIVVGVNKNANGDISVEVCDELLVKLQVHWGELANQPDELADQQDESESSAIDSVAGDRRSTGGSGADISSES